jgi:hypothetical protein
MIGPRRLMIILLSIALSAVFAMQLLSHFSGSSARHFTDRPTQRFDSAFVNNARPGGGAFRSNPVTPSRQQ